MLLGAGNRRSATDHRELPDFARMLSSKLKIPGAVTKSNEFALDFLNLFDASTEDIAYY
jgi:hypothetical protein